MKKVMITGACGLIGHQTLERLKNKYLIIGVDKKPCGGDETQKVDLAQEDDVRDFFAENREIDTVIHLAANPDENAEWDSILRDNIIAAKNIFEVSKTSKIKRIIFVSSTHLYGGYQGYPFESPLGRKILASDPYLSDSDYGDSKAYGEVLARRVSVQSDVNTISIRIGHVTTDNMPQHPFESLWLSYDDAAQVFERAVEAADISSGEYFAMSENSKCIYDITATKNDLGFAPKDSADDFN